MAYCDNCGNFDWSHIDGQQETLCQMANKQNHQPDLYYYWDAPLEEDYNWRNALPNVDCLCEICFDILNGEGKIKWQN